MCWGATSARSRQYAAEVLPQTCSPPALELEPQKRAPDRRAAAAAPALPAGTPDGTPGLKRRMA